MTPEPCHKCKGFCCAPTNGARGIRYGHDPTGVTGTHDCPACDDGTRGEHHREEEP